MKCNTKSSFIELYQDISLPFQEMKNQSSSEVGIAWYFLWLPFLSGDFCTLIGRKGGAVTPMISASMYGKKHFQIFKQLPLREVSRWCHPHADLAGGYFAVGKQFSGYVTRPSHHWCHQSTWGSESRGMLGAIFQSLSCQKIWKIEFLDFFSLL